MNGFMSAIILHNCELYNNEQTQFIYIFYIYTLKLKENNNTYIQIIPNIENIYN